MPDFVHVNVRLPAPDVEKIKGWAEERGLYWHELLRRLLHDAVDREVVHEEKTKPPAKVK